MNKQTKQQQQKQERQRDNLAAFQILEAVNIIYLLGVGVLWTIQYIKMRNILLLLNNSADERIWMYFISGTHNIKTQTKTKVE